MQSPQFYLIGKDCTIIAKFQGYAEKTKRNLCIL